MRPYILTVLLLGLLVLAACATSDTAGEAVKTCIDSDKSLGDMRWYTKGTVTIGNKVYVDYCEGDTVKDYACSSERTADKESADSLPTAQVAKKPGITKYYAVTESFACPDGCDDGACIEVPPPNCTETDAGIDYAVAGSITVISELYPDGQTFNDVCHSTSTLYEYYCPEPANESGGMDIYDCVANGYAGCADGACIEEPAPVCGDGMINQPSEECDGDDLGGATCEDFGYTGGTLGCAACSFVYTNCTNETVDVMPPEVNAMHWQVPPALVRSTCNATDDVAVSSLDMYVGNAEGLFDHVEGDCQEGFCLATADYDSSNYTANITWWTNCSASDTSDNYGSDYYESII